MNKKIVLTCEHAGHQVPEEYQHLFEGSEHVLTTHRGYDIGALALTEAITKVVDAELFTYSVTRLLIDPNRSPENPSVFSEFTKGLNQDEKQKIIGEFYERYRKQVEKRILFWIRQGYQVLHVAVHTFTPELDGVVRSADVGLLYDPRRPLEKSFCETWKRELHGQLSTLRIRMNYPYRGMMDGFTTWLRKEYEPHHYLGIEIEVNQKFVEVGNTKKWEQVQQLVATSLQSALEAE